VIQWLVVCTLIISFQFLQGDFTIHHDRIASGAHVRLIQNNLTRSLDTQIPEMYDETVTVLDEVLPLKGNGEFALAHSGHQLIEIRVDWTSFAPFSVSDYIVARVSNRVFVGESLCKSILSTVPLTHAALLTVISWVDRPQQRIY